MATKSAAKRVAEELLMRVGPAQAALPGMAAPATPVVRTGKPGRPKGRKNNRTLAEEAKLDVWSEKLIRERVALGLLDPVQMARKRATEVYGLEEHAPPDTIIHREVNGDGVVTKTVTLADAILELAGHFDGVKATEGKNALPYVRQKMPQQVDVTEKHLVLVRQVGMDDDGLPGDGAKNVTPKVLEHGDGL